MLTRKPNRTFASFLVILHQTGLPMKEVVRPGLKLQLSLNPKQSSMNDLADRYLYMTAFAHSKSTYTSSLCLDWTKRRLKFDPHHFPLMLYQNT